MSLWRIRILCLCALAALAFALWANMPYLRVEHPRLELWKLAGLLAGDILALLWFARFVFDHAMLGRPLSSLPLKDGRKHFRIVAIAGVAAIVIDLAFSLYLMRDARNGYKQGVITDAQVFAMQKHERPETTWYELDCTFKDQAGISHKAHLRIQAKGHVLPSALPSDVVGLLNAPGQRPGLFASVMIRGIHLGHGSTV